MRSLLLGLVITLLLAGCGTSETLPATGTSGTGSTTIPANLPHYDHIVVIIEENHSYQAVMESPDASYIRSLAQTGVSFSDAHGVAHPSEPNYLALFAGSTFGLTSDACPQSFAGPTLANALAAQKQTFIGYSESMPSAGYTGCFAQGDAFARKHNPWVDFADSAGDANQPLSAWPADFSQLPTVAYVVPNQANDMHSGTIATADTWLQDRLGSYITWAATHNSLTIITWDEDDDTAANHIPTIFVGAHLKAGISAQRISHLNVLKTIALLTGVTAPNDAAQAAPIDGIWAA